jgi:hypothetical protein
MIVMPRDGGSRGGGRRKLHAVKELVLRELEPPGWDREGALLQPLGRDEDSGGVPRKNLCPIPGSNEILHTDWASLWSSTVGIRYTAKGCACFDEQRMMAPRWFTWKRAELCRESCRRGWSTAQSVEEWSWFAASFHRRAQ